MVNFFLTLAAGLLVGYWLGWMRGYDYGKMFGAGIDHAKNMRAHEDATRYP
jgi:hypothetical protein